jgi:hypothetical protein
MADREKFFKGYGWVAGEDIEVIDEDGNYLGSFWSPFQDDILDVTDDPFTVWASDNGYSVDSFHFDGEYWVLVDSAVY